MTRLCVDRSCSSLWDFEDCNASLRQTRYYVNRKSYSRFREFREKIMRYVYN